MRILRDYANEAENNKIALGHFNFAELTVFKAAVAVARELNAPIILGTSEKEREFLGKDLLRSILRTSDVHIFFNADHTKSLEKVKEAVEVGYDSITFDASHLPLEENIKQTQEVVRYVKLVNPRILVEGEIGFIGDGSQVRDSVPEGVQKSTVEDAVRFVKQTGVDMLAPAVGNVHGLVRRSPGGEGGEPPLDIELIKHIKSALQFSLGRSVPLVLHGASGNTNEEIRAAIQAGISIVHVNTEVRLAWRTALLESLRENQNEMAPYTILNSAEHAAHAVIKNKLNLFNCG